MPTFKRNGVWYARAEVGKRRLEQSAGPGASRAQARELEQALYRRLLEDRHAKRIGASLNRTFGEALLEYMQLPETKRLRSYESLKSVANLIRPHLEDVRLEDVPVKAEEMKQAFLADGLKPATINRRLALVRRILKLAYHNWKWLIAPLTVSLLTEDNQRQVYPEADVAAELAAACPNRDAGDAVLVIYFTGMRRGEFFRVNADPDAYIENNVLKLYSGNKTKKPRRVPIAASIRPIIERMPLDVDEESLRYSFEKARETVGRPELHLHDLRHGFASLIAEAGGDLKTIGDLLGHVSKQTTDRYTHLLDKHLRRVIGKADRLAVGKRWDKTGSTKARVAK